MCSESPPDGGYGWLIVGACFLLNAFTWGVTASFGIYLSEYASSDKFTGIRPLEFGFVGGLNFSAAMLLAPLTTMLTRKMGIRIVMLSGCLLQSIGYVSASFASKTWHLYLTQGALVGFGISLIILPSTAVLSQWFSSRRSIANGISSAGSGVGGAGFAWGTFAAIEKFGFAWTLRITGLTAWAVTSIATLSLRDRNQHIGPSQLAFDVALLRRKEVILLLSWAFISMFGYVTLLFSLSEFSIALELSRQHATHVVGLLNVGTAIGRPLIGLISDRFSLTATAGVLTLSSGVACFALWLPAKSFSLLVVFSIISGAIMGVFWMTIGPLLTEVAELKHLQSLLSLAWVTIIIPTACAEVIALRLQELSTSRAFLYPQLFAGFSYLIAGIFMMWLWIINKPRLIRTAE